MRPKPNAYAVARRASTAAAWWPDRAAFEAWLGEGASRADRNALAQHITRLGLERLRVGVLVALSAADGTIRRARHRAIDPARVRQSIHAADLLDKAIGLLEAAGSRFDSRDSVLRHVVQARDEMLSDPSFAALAGAAPPLVLELARAKYPDLPVSVSPGPARSASKPEQAKPRRGGARLRVARDEMDAELMAAGVTARARRLLLRLLSARLSQ